MNPGAGPESENERWQWILPLITTMFALAAGAGWVLWFVSFRMRSDANSSVIATMATASVLGAAFTSGLAAFLDINPDRALDSIPRILPRLFAMSIPCWLVLMIALGRQALATALLFGPALSGAVAVGVLYAMRFRWYARFCASLRPDAPR